MFVNSGVAFDCYRLQAATRSPSGNAFCVPPVMPRWLPSHGACLVISEHFPTRRGFTGRAHFPESWILASCKHTISHSTANTNTAILRTIFSKYLQVRLFYFNFNIRRFSDSIPCFYFNTLLSPGGHPFHLRQQTPHHKLISSVDRRINLINHGELIFSNENKSKMFPLTVARNCQIILTIHLNSKTSHSHIHFPRETKLTRGKTR